MKTLEEIASLCVTQYCTSDEYDGKVKAAIAAAIQAERDEYERKLRCADSVISACKDSTKFADEGWQKAVAERDAQAKRIAELERERDHWKANHDNQVALKAAVLDRPDLQDRAKKVQKMAKRIAELEKALEPFAEYGKYWSDPAKYIKPEQPVGEFNGRGFMVTSFPLTHAHCRHAAEVLGRGKTYDCGRDTL